MNSLFRAQDFKMPDFRGNWREAWSHPFFRIEFMLSFLVNMALWKFISWYFPIIQAREGKVISDPIINMITPIDLSWWTFGFEYLVVVLGLTYAAFRPRQLMLLFETIFLLTVTRMATLYFFPLDPPIGIIPLEDPILGKLVYTGNVINKDLFFSGHTVMVFIMFLSVRHKLLKALFLVLTIFVASFLVIQHVHYSFDVLAAPFFTWIGYKIIDTAHK